MSEQREVMSTIVCGMTAVGKTYRTAREVEQYIAGNPSIGRKPRKVLIIDMNNEDEWKKYKLISPDDVHLFTRQEAIEGVRIGRIRKDGTIMTNNEISEMLKHIMLYFKGGLLIVEDIDKYMSGTKNRDMASLLTANRHSDLDIVIQHQSLSKITTTEWQNASIIRLHKQVDDPKRYEDRIPCPELVRLAKIIVDDQFMAGNNRYFINIDIRRLKLYGANEAVLGKACEKYLRLEPKVMRAYTNDAGGSRDAAVQAFKQDCIQYLP